MQQLGARQVCKTPLQRIHTKEAGEWYTKLTHYSEAPPNFYVEGCSASPATLLYGNAVE